MGEDRFVGIGSKGFENGGFFFSWRNRDEKKING